MAIPTLAALGFSIVPTAFLAVGQIADERRERKLYRYLKSASKNLSPSLSPSKDLNTQIENVQERRTILLGLNKREKSVFTLNLISICATVAIITLSTTLSPLILVALKVSIVVSATQAFLTRQLSKGTEKNLRILNEKMSSLFHNKIDALIDNYQYIMKMDNDAYPDLPVLKDTAKADERIDNILNAEIFNKEEMDKVGKLCANLLKIFGDHPSWKMDGQDPMKLIITQANSIKDIYKNRNDYESDIQQLVDKHEKTMWAAFNHIQG